MASLLALDTNNILNVRGLVEIITGGGTSQKVIKSKVLYSPELTLSGLGAAMAQALASRGATVFILGRRFEKLHSLVEDQLPHLSDNIIPVGCDVTKKESLETAAQFVATKTDFVNLVIANAGVPAPQDTALNRIPTEPRGPPTLDEMQTHLRQTSMDEFTDTYRVNLAGAHSTAVAFLGLLDKDNRRRAKSRSRVQLVAFTEAGWLAALPTLRAKQLPQILPRIWLVLL